MGAELTERGRIEAAIAALEAQREALGDAVAETALSPLRANLSALSDGEPHAPKLRQVTILFTDLVGSTAMGRKLDPEDTHELMDRVLRRFTTIVRERGGRVLKYTGDGLLAAFGANEAQEDDAENAVRVGLTIIEETKHLASGIASDIHPAGFKVRVGIDTGPVLLGGSLEGENNIHGNAVNLAARMEQSAPEGCLRISHNTYVHVRGLFNVTEQPPIKVKGIDEPLRTYLVRSAKPRAFRVVTRGIEGIETRMVGREGEFAALQRAFQALFKECSLRAVTVVADAGVGKSRLLYEFENWAEVQPQTYFILKGRAQPQTRQRPYGLLRDILAWRFQIADSDTAETARRKLVANLAPVFAAEGEAPAHLLGHLIGIDFSESPHVAGIVDDPQQIRARAFHAGVQMFRHFGSQAPVVLILDDLHWADDGTLDFLGHLGTENTDTATLLLAFTRPLLFERRAMWIDDEAHHTRVDLKPLGPAETRELTDVLLQKLEEVPAWLRERITASGDGNPFFMEEIVKMLLDEGAIVASDANEWRIVPEKLSAVQVPTTLKGVLQARMDALAAKERMALQQASVIGFLFWDRAVAALDHRSPPALTPLSHRGFVVVQAASALVDAREFTFQHHLLHQFTYDSVLKRERREYHARAASWFVPLAAERGAEFLGITGEHYERAGAASDAVAYYTRAAEDAAARDARKGAFGYIERALALVAPNDHATRWRLHAVCEGLLALEEDRVRHAVELDALDAEAAALNEDAKRAYALSRRAKMLRNEGEYHRGALVARDAIHMAEGAGAAIIAAEACGDHAVCARRLGDFAIARALTEKGLTLARKEGNRSVEGELLQALAAVVSEQGDYAAGYNIGVEALEIFRAIGNKVRESNACNGLGDICVRLGEYDRAREYFRAGLRLSEEIGWTFTVSVLRLNLAAVANLLSNYEDAVAEAREAVRIAVANNARDLEAAAYLPLGLALTALARYDEARVALARSRDLFELNKGHHLAMEPIAGLALNCLAQGDRIGALAEVETVLGHLAVGGHLDGTEEPLRILLSCYQVLHELVDPRASGLLNQAHAQLQARAERIANKRARRRFLADVPHHRTIMRAWRC